MIVPSVPAKPLVPIGDKTRLILKSDNLTRTCPLDGNRGWGIFQTRIFSDLRSR